MASPDINQLLAQAAASQGPASAAGTQVMNVYLGSTAGSTRFAGKALPDGEVVPAPSDRIAEQAAAENQIYGWSAAQRKQWEQTLLDAGLIKPGEYNYADLVQMWQGAVEGAAALYTYGSKKVTPQQYVKNFLGTDGVGGSGGPKTTTNTSTSVAHFDDLDARGVARDAYASALGRASNQHEDAALQAALNAYAQAHPAISKTTTTTDGSGNSQSSTNSHGGIDTAGVQELAQEQIQQKPEYASYQAAATYFPLLEQALNATANVGV